MSINITSYSLVVGMCWSLIIVIGIGCRLVVLYMELFLVPSLSIQFQIFWVHLFAIDFTLSFNESWRMLLTLLYGFMLKGRRRELITAALLYVFGGLLTSYAPGLNVLLLGRLVYGLGIGLVRFSQTTLLLKIYLILLCPYLSLIFFF